MRVGAARFGSGTALSGLRPIVLNLSLEGLIRIGDDGRAEPRLAQDWSVGANGLSIRLRLKDGVKFQDGSALSASTVVNVLNTSLPRFMGPLFDDIDRIAAVGPNVIEIHLRRVSPLVQEALEVQVRKPDDPSVGTGPFSPVNAESLSELRAHRDYHLGAPAIDRIVLSNYPSVRAAWADMLRDKVDMLYEVSADALDLMEDAKNVSLYTFTRPYQYMVVLNVRSSKLRSIQVRRALNLAIDRAALVRDAFDGHASPSAGPIWPRHWAFREDFPTLASNPSAASTLLSGINVGQSAHREVPLRFTCLVPPDYERVALVVQQQLEAFGILMELREASSDEAVRALSSSDFEAVILDAIEGPSIFRVYQWWHSGGSQNPGALGSPTTDRALDRIRHAASEDEYRAGVAAFQQTAIDDPPAIFLAWGQRARAVSRRFDVQTEQGRDVLTTLRLWRPVIDQRAASRN